MRIVITAENSNGLDGMVALHFGHAPFFVLVDMLDGQAKAVQSIANPFAETHQPGEIPTFIKEKNADVILSGGMGGRAIEFFTQKGIKVATGASGTVRETLENYLCGKLQEAAPCDNSVAHGHG